MFDCGLTSHLVEQDGLVAVLLEPLVQVEHQVALGSVCVCVCMCVLDVLRGVSHKSQKTEQKHAD